MSAVIAESIRSQLAAGLDSAVVEVFDDSARHKGHAEAKRSGGGHYQVRVISPSFAGKTALERHRLVYTILANLLQTRVHALNIEALTPEEAI